MTIDDENTRYSDQDTDVPKHGLCGLLEDTTHLVFKILSGHLIVSPYKKSIVECIGNIPRGFNKSDQFLPL